jgi:hypothetical protein
MKVWMWQRLYKWYGDIEVFEELRDTEDELNYDPLEISQWRWLCPKPNLVLVDRKHLQ